MSLLLSKENQRTPTATYSLEKKVISLGLSPALTLLGSTAKSFENNLKYKESQLALETFMFYLTVLEMFI